MIGPTCKCICLDFTIGKIYMALVIHFSALRPLLCMSMTTLDSISVVDFESSLMNWILCLVANHFLTLQI
jgi:hypothetical protein